MNEYFWIPVIMATMLGLLSDLEDISYDVSEKTEEFAQNALDALDCAYDARPITECSPEITNTDYSQEIERTHELLIQAQSQ